MQDIEDFDYKPTGPALNAIKKLRDLEREFADVWAVDFDLSTSEQSRRYKEYKAYRREIEASLYSSIATELQLSESKSK